MAASAKCVLLMTAALLLLDFPKINSKECTNTPTQSHTVRQALLSAENLNDITKNLEQASSIDNNIVAHEAHYFMRRDLKMGRFADSGGLLSVSKGAEDMPFLQDLSLHDVVIHADSLQGRAQQTNLEYLLMLDVDNLVWSFRKTANLSTIGNPYGGWEAPTSELRGHFVGHYMSATAHMWASTHNDTLNGKMTAVVDALYECQQAIGTGYLSAFPTEFFDRFESIQPVWAPYYTIHKIMAGLLDQYEFAGNNRALQMAVSMAEYFNGRVLRVIEIYTIERHWESLNEETGGMNDVLYRLYTLTDNVDNLRLAHFFDKPCFLGPLAIQADSISGFHANTHIPIVVGAEARFEVVGDSAYKDIGIFFMDIVNSSHSYPTGGTSAGEFWTDPLRLGDALSTTETEESCTTYNMLKVSRHLFRWTRDMKYADYYERALTNGVLSIQRGQEPGVMIYMLPMGKGMSKAISYHGWGTQFNSFWCCYGTGIESFSKLGDSIYFEETGTEYPSLYVVQFVSSSLAWHTIGLILEQRVDISSTNLSLHVAFKFSSINQDTNTSATIILRIPAWVEASNSSLTINGATQITNITSGEFLHLTRAWIAGDEIELLFPVLLRTEKLKDDRDTFSTLQSVFFGPYLLAGMTKDDWDITGVNLDSLSSWITPVPDTFNENLYSFSQLASEQTTYLGHFTDISLSMHLLPSEGTNEAVQCTFRLVDPVLSKLISSTCLDLVSASIMQSMEESFRDETGILSDLIGKLVAIEPFDLPGSVVMHKSGRLIGIVKASLLENHGDHCDLKNHLSGIHAVYHIVPGGAHKNHISFEAVSKPGCFIARSRNSVSRVDLWCKAAKNDEIVEESLFTVNKPLTEYHPMSFTANGANRNFLLFPLIGYRDENYTVFFNITNASSVSLPFPISI